MKTVLLEIIIFVETTHNSLFVFVQVLKLLEKQTCDRSEQLFIEGQAMLHLMFFSESVLKM